MYTERSKINRADERQTNIRSLARLRIFKEFIPYGYGTSRWTKLGHLRTTKQKYEFDQRVTRQRIFSQTSCDEIQLPSQNQFLL